FRRYLALFQSGRRLPHFKSWRIFDCDGKAQLRRRFFHGGVTLGALSASRFAKSREAERKKRGRAALATAIQKASLRRNTGLKACALSEPSAHTSQRPHRSPDLCSLTFILLLLLK